MENSLKQQIRTNPSGIKVASKEFCHATMMKFKYMAKIYAKGSGNM